MVTNITKSKSDLTSLQIEKHTTYEAVVSRKRKKIKPESDQASWPNFQI